MTRNTILSVAMWFIAAFTAGAWQVQLPEAPSPAEVTARQELEHYLEAVAGSSLTVDGDGDVTFYLGDSDFSRSLGIDAATLADEEWLIRAEAGNVALLGGGERGTLYAVYHFLEDQLGVRWWGPGEETVPRREGLALPRLNRAGRPFFRQREVYRHWSNLIPDGGRFAARRRLNRDGERGIAAEFGGQLRYGGPYFVHTFHMYLPEDRYFADHPEYYALVNGQRAAGPQSQLCHSNPEMRRELYNQLQKRILADEQAAAAAGEAPPTLYSLSMNDCKSPCQCPECRAVVEREYSGMGPMLECLNEIAGKLREFRPGILLSTLAYYDTEAVPATLRPADNLLIVLCDTSTNQAQPLTAPENLPFRELLENWSRIAPLLGVWDYSITFELPNGPYPHEYALPENMRLYADNHVQYLFFEHEVAECADWYVANVWLESRLLEDPYQNAETLRREFLDGYFEAAAPQMAEYRRLLWEACRDTPARIGWFATASEYKHIDWANAIVMQRLFDDAETAVAGRPELRRRVRRARLNLDRICTLNYNRLANAFVAAGNDVAAFPLIQREMAERARHVWLAEIDRLLEPARASHSRNQAEAEFAAVAGVVYAPHRPPSRFAGREHLDFPADRMQLYYGVQVSGDPEAESAYVISRTVGSPVLHFGRYIPPQQRIAFTGTVEPHADAATGFQWHKLGEWTPEPGEYLYFYGDWAVQYHWAALLQDQPKRKYEFWASVKFDDAGRIGIERLVLVPAE